MYNGNGDRIRSTVTGLAVRPLFRIDVHPDSVDNGWVAVPEAFVVGVIGCGDDEAEHVRAEVPAGRGDDEYGREFHHETRKWEAEGGL